MTTADPTDEPLPHPAPPPAPATPAPGPVPAPPEFLAMAEELGIVFDPGDVERLGRYLGMLLEANRSFNLTSITEPGEAWTRHILDALTLVAVLAEVEPGGSGKEADREDGGRDEEGEGAQGRAVRIVDIGSGGGVPGIPLAIVMPAVDFTLVEATGKKAEFLRRTAVELGLKNVTVLNDRAERLGQVFKASADGGPHREAYDVAIARALGHLAVVAELASPLVRVDGLVLAVKGARAEEELAESVKALGMLRLHHAATVGTPTGRIVVLQKTGRTPRPYPRRDGEPKRAPLGLGREKGGGRRGRGRRDSAEGASTGANTE